MNGICEKAAACPLFEGMDENEINDLLSRGSVSVKRFAKGSVILHSGEVCRSVCIVASGSAAGETVTEDGRIEETASFGEGGVFGDLIAMSGSGESPVTVKAEAETEIIFVPVSDVLNCRRMTANMARSISEKYFSLRFRLSCLTKSTLREKIMNYLYHSAGGKTGVVFTVPFSHSELADYLSVDRSALTRELTSLRREGIIDYYGKNYKINTREEK